MINSIPADPLRIFFIALISVHIASSEEGVVADGFEFIVEHLPSDSQNTRSSVQESPGKKAIHHERSTGLKENQPFPIQKKAPSVKKNKLLVFDNKTDSLIYRTNAAIENKPGFNLNKSKTDE